MAFYPVMGGGSGNSDITKWLARGYSSTSNYGTGDYCVYNNTLYKCIKGTTGSFDSSAWELAYVMDKLNKSTPATGSYFGFMKIKSVSAPSARIVYEGDCVDYTPAYMDFDNDKFEYGDWEDAFFMPKPVLLAQDGTVFCYLNPNDYAIDVDGNNVSSYLSGSSGIYNAMMQWPKIYVSRTQDDYFEHTRIASYKIDETYHCYSNYDANGKEIDYFYTPIYNGSVIGSTLRSISGQIPLNGKTGTDEITYATANNQTTTNEWYIEQWCDRALINDLLVLIGKSTNTQDVFGYGHYTGGSSASNLLTSGTMNEKGMFWGSKATGQGVKVFGMENYWGNIWRRTAGLMTNGTAIYAKMTWDTTDSTGVTGYQTTSVTGYTALGKSAGGSSGGYISATYNSKYGCVPHTASGSQTTYETDGLWFGNVVGYALVGGYCDVGFLCGAFALALDYAVSGADWDFGASVSCKPLAS